MAIQYALDAKYYLGPAGSEPTEEFDLMEAQVTENPDEQTLRWRSSPFVMTYATTLNVTVSGKYVWDELDTQFQTLLDAYTNRKPVALKFVSKQSADGLSNGSGLDADWIITQFNRNDTEDQISLVELTFKPTYQTRMPQRIANSLA